MEKEIKVAKAGIITVIAIMVMCSVMLSDARAQDTLINTKVESVTTKVDKNGNDYTRIIVKEDRELNGIKYQIGVPVMVFGDELVSKARTLTKGDQLKAICSINEYKGRKNYQMIAFVE